MGSTQRAQDTATSVVMSDVYGQDFTVELDGYHESVTFRFDVPAFTGSGTRHLDAAGARALAARLTAFATMIDEAE